MTAGAARNVPAGFRLRGGLAVCAVCVCVCLGMWLTIYTCSALVMLAHHKKIFQIDGSCQFGRNERG
jgi:hypothetical protein